VSEFSRADSRADVLVNCSDRQVDWCVNSPFTISAGWNGVSMADRSGDAVRVLAILIHDPAACHTDELDDCASVKCLTRIELSAVRGRDTRPADEQSHGALHEAQSEPDAN
jgi:hypothetical protein